MPKTKRNRTEYMKKWRQNNKDKIDGYDKPNKEYFKRYRQENKERLAAIDKEWKAANPDKVLATNRRYLKKLNLANAEISQRTLAAWALQIKERDNNMCQLCGSSDRLHAHHIFSKSNHPTLALILNNGVTLCEICHMEEHRLNGDL